MRSLFRLPRPSVCDFPRILSLAASLTFTLLPAPATCLTLCLNEDPPQDSADLLRRWGCSDDDISRLFSRRPSLRRANLAQLRSKLQILTDTRQVERISILARPTMLVDDSCRRSNMILLISKSYVLEYGTDCLEMHVGAVEPGERAIVIDDLVATGGTLSAAIKLLERVGAEVVECAYVIGLPEVKDCCRIKRKPLYILVEPRLLDVCC